MRDLSAARDALANRFFNEDCITGARRHIPTGTVDLIITDPPYGIRGDTLDRHYNRDESYVAGGYVEVPAEEYARFSEAWVAEAARVLRPGGAIYVVSGYTNLSDILHALKVAGLREVNHLIWKFNFGVYTELKFISSHYHILYYTKHGGTRTFHTESRVGLLEKDESGGSLNYQDREDVWMINREYKPGRVKNKNELPCALLTKMIQYSSNEGDLVCDLFLGGFSTARVAIGLGRYATGFEISAPIFEAKVSEVMALPSGYLLAEQRNPVIVSRGNRRQPWKEDEKGRLLTRYRTLIGEGSSKKGAIDLLGEEFGRGYWAIWNVLKEGGEVKARDQKEGGMSSG
jgi:site-specific DNA-methyltransferase (adenine-specific)